METLDENFIETGDSGFALSKSTVHLLNETGKWARFLSILGFTFLGFMVIGGLFLGTMAGSMGDELGLGISPVLLSSVYVGVSALYFLPFLFLYRFGHRVSIAIKSGDNAVMNSAFESLRSHYRYFGIMAIVMIAVYIIMLFLMGAGFSGVI